MWYCTWDFTDEDVRLALNDAWHDGSMFDNMHRTVVERQSCIGFISLYMRMGNNVLPGKSERTRR